MTTPISFDKSVVEGIASPYVSALATAHSPLDLEDIRKDDVVKDAARNAGVNVDDVATYDAFTRAIFEVCRDVVKQAGGAIPVHEPQFESTTTTPPPQETGQNDWSKWRGPGLLVLGALAVIGSIFTSEQGGRGKPLMAAIGGGLIVGSILSWLGKSVSWLGWLFGSESESGGEQKSTSPVTDGASPTQS